MNVAKAIEIALSNTIRRFGNISNGIVIRAWQTLGNDKGWQKKVDRDFPVVDVRCAPFRVDENQSTLVNDCAVLCGALAKDDMDHAIVSKLYDDVQTVINKLFAQFRNSDPAAELNFFNSEMLRIMGGASSFNFGGFTIGDPGPPRDENGVSMIGTTLSVHYSRDDF